MKRRGVVALLCAGTSALALAGFGIRLGVAQPAPAASSVRFAAVDVFVDSAEPLAAWQFELTEASGSMTVVGVENGESAAFDGTPLYDLDAVAEGRAERIIVADYSLADRDVLPVGRTRVATVHVRLTGAQSPDFELQLIAAGNSAGDAIRAAAVFELQQGRAE